MRVAARLRRHDAAPVGAWSIAALMLAGAGVAASTWFVLSTDGDPGGVLWPLVIAPIAITLVPVIVPRDRVRVGAVVALGCWCVLTGFSIGFLLVPALVAQVTAAVKEQE